MCTQLPYHQHSCWFKDQKYLGLLLLPQSCIPLAQESSSLGPLVTGVLWSRVPYGSSGQKARVDATLGWTLNAESHTVVLLRKSWSCNQWLATVVFLKAAFRDLSTEAKYREGRREGTGGTLGTANGIHVISTVVAVESVLKPPACPSTSDYPAICLVL